MPIPSLVDCCDTQALRRHVDQRHELLLQARQPWLDFCVAVAEELLPSRLPYLHDPHHTLRAGQQNQKLVDSVGPVSLRTAAAGIGSGTMPPTEPWFELTVRNQWGQDDEVRLFLQQGADRMRSVINQSNSNQVLSLFREERQAFGVGACLMHEDDDDVIRLEPLSVGEYCIAEDHRGRVDTLYRRLTMTVGQLVDEFGLEACSPTVQSHYGNGFYDIVIPCLHAIEPDRDRESPELPWRSMYAELTAGTTQLLAVRGYRRFPALVSRWAKLPGTAYGYGPGMDALPHLVRLRRLIFRYGQAVAFKSEPAVSYPREMQAHEVRLVPGGKTAVFGTAPVQQVFRAELELKEVAEEIARTRQDVRDTLGATLVASLRSITHQMTATEVQERTVQNLQEFLPAIWREFEELHEPFIEWLWDRMADIGQLPPAPESLGDQRIDIEFRSPLARKQRQGEVDAIVRTYAIAGEIGKVRPEVLDVLSPDRAVRRIAEIEGAPADALSSEDEVRELRQGRQQVQLAQQQAMAAQQGADVAKTVSEVEANRGAQAPVAA